MWDIHYIRMFRLRVTYILVLSAIYPIHPYIHVHTIHTSIHLSVYPFIHQSVHPCVCPAFYSSLHPSIRTSIHHFFIPLFVSPLINPFIYNEYIIVLTFLIHRQMILNMMKHRNIKLA